jgi:membrane protein DedA with SNARE-associated domain
MYLLHHLWQRLGYRILILVAFLVSAVCGFSSITSTTFYVTIGALAKGVASPLFVGLAGGTGVCLSDSIFYYVISKGSSVIYKHLKKFENFVEKKDEQDA